MSILAVDFGEKKVGLAISYGFLAKPLGVLLNNAKIFSKLEKICQEFKVAKIIIGLPEGKLRPKVLKFGENCQDKLKIKVEFESEILTTEKAEKFLIEAKKAKRKRQKTIDAAAAAVILQDFLEGGK